MKHFLLLLIILTIGSSVAKAQIRITEADYLAQAASTNGNNSFSVISISRLAALVAASGPNQTWDFTTLSYSPPSTGGATTILVYPGGAPLASDPDFTSSTHIVKVGTQVPGTFTYEYLRLTPNGFWLLGIVRDSSGTASKIISWVPARQYLAFPLTYGTTWQSSSLDKQPGAPAGYSQSDTVQSIVDAYGSLITPPGKSEDALRVKQRFTYVTTNNSITTKRTSYSFGWFTKTGKSANISTDSSLKPFGGSYSEPASGSSVTNISKNSDNAFHLMLSSNPSSSSETKLYYTMQHEGAVSVTIMNALGRSVLSSEIPHATVGENLLPIDVQKLEAGTYFIRVITPQNIATQKLVVVK